MKGVSTDPRMPYAVSCSSVRLLLRTVYLRTTYTAELTVGSPTDNGRNEAIVIITADPRASRDR